MLAKEGIAYKPYAIFAKNLLPFMTTNSFEQAIDLALQIDILLNGSPGGGNNLREERGCGVKRFTKIENLTCTFLDQTVLHGP